MNRYLMDRAMRKGGMSMRDGRNPYGSKGGYVTSRRGRRDRAMDYNYSYPERDNRYDERHYRPMDYEQNDYARDYDDYGEYDMARGRRYWDYADYDMDREWNEHLKRWTEELKQNDKFKVGKEQVIQMAKQMGVKFDQYNEEEFMTAYYMILSDYDGQLISSPQTAVAFAKKWLEDKNSKLKGSEKLCAYYYEIVKGGEE